MLFLSRRIDIVTHMDVKFVVLLVQLVSSLSFYLMNSYISLFINSDLQYPLIEATYWAGVYQLVGSGVAAVAAPFTGFLYDRLGMKKIWLIILSGNVVAYTGLAVSTNLLEIVFFRGLQGCFAMSTVVFAFSASVASAGELKKSLSYQLAAMTIGQLIGPGIGGILASTVGYRLVFATASLLFVSMFPVVSILKTPPQVARERDAPNLTVKDVRAIIPDAFSLVLVYMCMYFIWPIIPWFLESLGVPYEQLII
jgi:DHA1 family multidrug resistance protein-like MFS transporter